MTSIAKIPEAHIATIVPAPINPMQMLASAIERGIDADSLGKLMDLQERHEANQARKEFVAAMAAFKSDPPKIKKSKHVRFQTSKGLTEYDHATLDDVSRAVGIAMAPHGMSFRWQTKQEGAVIDVTCILQHVGGHSETVTLQGSADQSGGKNAIQAVGSTVTYLQRYTLLAATGLAAEDEDDDGRAAAAPSVERINADQAQKIRDGLKATGTSEADFLKWAMPGVHGAAIESVHASQYHECLAMLTKKFKQQQAQREHEQAPEPEVKF